MAYIQKNLPPPNKILQFSLRNFAGGLNNRTEIPNENEASDLNNMSFYDSELMVRRYGSEFYDEQTCDAEVTHLDVYKPYTDANMVVRATNGKLYMGSEMVQVVAGQVNGVTFMGRYYFVDGGALYVYGKFPQVDALPYTNVIGTPVDAYVVMKVITPLAGFVPLPVEHTRGVNNYDYTNKVVYYEPCDNEIKDTFKQGNVVPDKPTFITVHKGRLFVSGSTTSDDNVFISDLNNPYYYCASLPLQVPPDSDKVKGLCVYDDAVVVGRHYDMYVITGDTNRTGVGFELFRLQKLNTHTGVANHRTMNVAHNYLFFLGSDGNAYAMSSVRQDHKILSTALLTERVDFFKSPINVNRVDINTAVGTFGSNEWHLAFKDKTMVYSYLHRAWTMYSNLNMRSMMNLDETIIWGNKNGRLVKYSTTNFLDCNVPYQSYWSSKNLDMGDVVTYKQLREFYIVAHTFDDKLSNIDVQFQIDYVDMRDRYSVSNQISRYGRAKWGDRYINRNIIASLPFVVGRRGRTIRFTFSNGRDVFATVADVAGLDTVVGRTYGTLVYATSESKYYLYDGSIWTVQEDTDLNQPMRVYQVNGDYEFRGKR